MFTVCSLMSGLISYFISAIFNRKIYLPVIFFALIILNMETLSLLKGINGENTVLLTFIEFLAVYFVWIKKGKPTLKFNFKDFFTNLKNALLEDKSLILLCIAWCFLIIISFILASFFPSSEADAQIYHTNRVLFWLKDGFISHFETPNSRNHCMPINSELFYTWLLCLTKNDHKFGLLQLFSYLTLIISSFKVMEFFKFDFTQRIWAILIFTSFASVIIQISSTQTDICIAALLMVSAYLILIYKENPKLNLLFFASLSVAIACGVKTTAFLAFTPMFIWYCFLIKKDIFKFIGFGIINFMIFSSYNYILNYITYGNFISNSTLIVYHKYTGGAKGFISNLIKYIFQFIDFSGFNIGNYLNKYLMNFRNSILSFLSIPEYFGEIDTFEKFNVYLDEQKGGLGILGFLVFLPCTIIGLFKKNTKLFAVFFWLQLFILSAFMGYTVFAMRYICTFVAIGFPVLALSYSKKMNVLKFIIILYALNYLFISSWYSPARPLAQIIKDIREHNINLNEIQENVRNLDYSANPFMRTEAKALNDSIKPYCKDGNRIGIAPHVISGTYPAKYLELNNNCTIDTLNLVHAGKYDFSKYDVIILLKEDEQNTNAINKEDMKNMISETEKSVCNYVFYGNIDARKLGYALCSVKLSYLSGLGFKSSNKEFTYASFELNDTKIQYYTFEPWVKEK